MSIKSCSSLIVVLISLVNLCTGQSQPEVNYDEGPDSIRLSFSFDEAENTLKWYSSEVFPLKSVLYNSKMLKNSDEAVVRVPTSKESLTKLQKLAEADGYYKLKIDLETTKKKTISFNLFAKVRRLLDAGFDLLLVIYLDHNESVVGVSHRPNFGRTSAPGKGSEIRTELVFRTIEQGPVPDTASYIQKLERDREILERGATQDNRSFFARYWMYIVPVVIFAVISGSANADGNQPTR